MKEIINGEYFALFSQIVLIDVEATDAYPQWMTGEEIAVLHSKGVAVSALGDSLIHVIVYEGDELIGEIEYISGVIDVGSKGLLVGNEAAGTSSVFPWPTGRTKIKVYANAPKDKATSIKFILQRLGE